MVERTMYMQMDWSYVFAVVISGLVLVFVALILLILAVSVMGKIFTSVKEKKTDAPAPAAPPVREMPVIPEAPAADDDETEIAAVIAAAVAAISEESGKALRVKSIRPANGQRRSSRGSWAAAAARESIQ